MTAAKTHSTKRVILRTVLIAAVICVLLAAAAGFNWVYNMYLAFNNPVLTGSDPFVSDGSLEELDRLTDSDKLMAKKILDEKGIPYKESFGTTIFVRNGNYNEASYALVNSGYEFDGVILR